MPGPRRGHADIGREQHLRSPSSPSPTWQSASSASRSAPCPTGVRAAPGFTLRPLPEAGCAQLNQRCELRSRWCRYTGAGPSRTASGTLASAGAFFTSFRSKVTKVRAHALEARWAASAKSKPRSCRPMARSQDDHTLLGLDIDRDTRLPAEDLPGLFGNHHLPLGAGAEIAPWSTSSSSACLVRQNRSSWVAA